MSKVNEPSPILNKWDFIFLLGESGGGKGTLVKNIKQFWKPDVVSASMGDIFREKAKTDPVIKQLTEEGILIDDKIVAQQFRLFAENSAPGIIDGYPRNRQQALDSIKFIKSMGWRVLVINLHCDIEVIIERLLARGRTDDKLSIMYKRNSDHKTYHPQVMREIKNRPDLFDVIDLNGNFNEEEVFTDFMLAILRLVDLLYLYDMSDITASFHVNPEETTSNRAIARMVCELLNKVQENLDNTKTDL